MRNKIVLLVAAVVVVILAATAIADVPRIISYQGRLKNTAGVPYNGSKLTKFIIYDGAGVDIWNTGFISVTYDSGLCAVKLGLPPQPALPTSNWTSDTGLTLGITVDVDPEISPRTRFTTVGYAMHAKNSESTPWAGITGVSVINADVNAAANIDATKINGTAATLTANNVFTGSDNVFQQGLEVGPGDDLVVAETDLALRRAFFYRWRLKEGSTTGLQVQQIYDDAGSLLNNVRFEIGDQGNIGIQSAPTAEIKVRLNPPDLASTSPRYGLWSNIENSSTGDIYGAQTRAYATTPSSGGNALGLSSEGRTDASGRFGIYAVAQGTTFSPAIGGSSYGVYGLAYDGGTAYGVYGYAAVATTDWAGYFAGNLHCTGTLSKGLGAFRIDHPLDPENKILQHSFVESPDMMNIYNGNVTTDNAGSARVILPEYFEALNRDFRYQLTVLGQFAQAIVAEEISGNQFTIRTDKPNVKVSWQVTGVRHDKLAEANRIQVELDKLPNQKGLYLHAEAFGLPVDKSVDRDALRDAEKSRVESAAQQPE